MSAGDDHEDDDEDEDDLDQNDGEDEDEDEVDDEDPPSASAPEPVPAVIELADLRRLAGAGSPAFGQALIDFAEQPDPPSATAPPAGALTLSGLLSTLRNLRHKKAAERRKLASEAFHRFLSQPD